MQISKQYPYTDDRDLISSFVWYIIKHWKFEEYNIWLWCIVSIADNSMSRSSSRWNKLYLYNFFWREDVWTWLIEHWLVRWEFPGLFNSASRHAELCKKKHSYDNTYDYVTKVCIMPHINLDKFEVKWNKR